MLSLHVFTDVVPLVSGFTDGSLDQRIWLDEVQCRGIEDRLIDCRANPLGSHNCRHSQDAGVGCLVNITSVCTEGDIRLQGGNSTHGRVEICFNNVWGTICNDSWGISDAQVACRQLGFPTKGGLTYRHVTSHILHYYMLQLVYCVITYVIR